MVRFKRLIVENYKSIEFAEVNFLEGIYKVLGDNQDSVYNSNGAGKSSILQAIVLGLYNKDFSGVPLDTLSNRFTKKLYTITTEFDVTTNGITSTVQVINPGGAARMRVLINGELKANGSTLAVPLVEKLLGMGYTTFRLTHFITSSTITSLTQNLSQPTLFNDILHIVELQDLDKRLLLANKEITLALEEAKVKLKLMVQHTKLLEFKSRYSEEDIKESLAIIETQIAGIDQENSSLSFSISKSLDEATVQYHNFQQLITQTRTTLREGICSMCGTILADKDSLVSLNAQLADYEVQRDSAKIQLDEYKTRLTILSKNYQDKKALLLRDSVVLSQDLNMAKEVADIAIEVDPKLLPLVTDLEDQLLFISTARKEIKSGKVIKNILDQFFEIISIKLLEYSTLIRLDHFSIGVVNDRLGMAITLKQGIMDVPIDSLSNGEKTRLSLLILVSMLDAMKVVSDSETNLVVLDEAASSFDKSGIEELSALFSHLKHLGQSIFIITHGSEMDAVPYDYELMITKTEGCSTAITKEI